MFGEEVPYKQISPEQDPNVLRGIWDAAKGLQKVDNLEPTDLIDEVAEQNINGHIGTDEASEIVRKHYAGIADPKIEAQEADMATANIVNLLARNGFMLTPATLQGIHREIFKGIPLHGNTAIEWAGVYRTEDFEKEEEVLDGRSVHYSSHMFIKDQLRIVFEDEQAHQYGHPFGEEDVSALARFMAKVWQVHPFWEGNTRATAVFLIQYLRSMGFEVENEPFKENSKHFRDSLALATFYDNKLGIARRPQNLEGFLQELL